MNEQERVELERLKERQARLEHELKLLSGQLTLFEQRLKQPTAQPTPPTPQIAIPRDKLVEVVRQEAAPTPKPPTPARIHIEKPPPPVPPVIAPTTPVSQSSIRLAPATPKPAPAPEAAPTTAARVPVPAQPVPAASASPAPEPFSKCTCEACGGHLEFPTSRIGDTIPCPHCGLPALLSVEPRPIPVPPRVSAAAIPRGEPPGRAGGTPALLSKPAKEGSWELRWACTGCRASALW